MLEEMLRLMLDQEMDMAEMAHQVRALLMRDPSLITFIGKVLVVGLHQDITEGNVTPEMIMISYDAIMQHG